MFRVLVASLMVYAAASAVDAGQKPRRYRGAGFDGPHAPPYFVKNIKPLMSGISHCKELVLYEGLPHPEAHEELFTNELKEKRTIKLEGHAFYEEQVSPKEDLGERLRELCSDRANLGRYRGGKFCGGFHPDWCLEFRDDGRVYRVLVCFGCREAQIIGPDHKLMSELAKSGYTELHAVLSPLRKNCPKPKPLFPAAPP